MAACEDMRFYEVAGDVKREQQHIPVFHRCCDGRQPDALSVFVSLGNLYYRPAASHGGRAGFRRRCLGDTRFVLCFKGCADQSKSPRKAAFNISLNESLVASCFEFL